MTHSKLAFAALVGTLAVATAPASASLITPNYTAVVNAANQPPPPGVIALQPTVVGSKSGTFTGTGPLVATYASTSNADGVVQGSLPPSPNSTIYSAPFVSPGVQTTLPYFSTALGSITTSLSVGEGFLGVLWGSVDPSNSLSFYSGQNGTGTFLGSILGTDVAPTVNGSQTFGGSRYVDVTFTTPFQSFVTTSGVVSYEYANVTAAPGTFGSPVPEPISLALFGAGLVGLGVIRSRRSA